MALLERVIGKLRELQTTYSVEALTKPSHQTEFEYGKHCGVIEGLRRAEQLVLEEVEEKRNER